MQADSRLVQARSWSRSRRWRSTRIRVAATMAYRTCHAMTSGRSMLAIEQTRCASTARGADHLVEHGERVRHAQRCAMNRAGIDGVVQTEHAARMVESVRRPAVRAVECHAPSRTRSAMGPSPKGVPGEATTLGAGEESPVLRAAIRSGSTEARNQPTTTAGSRRSGRASLGTPRGYADVPLALRTPVGHRAAMVPYPSLPVPTRDAARGNDQDREVVKREVRESPGSSVGPSTGALAPATTRRRLVPLDLRRRAATIRWERADSAIARGGWSRRAAWLQRSARDPSLHVEAHRDGPKGR